MKHVLFALIVTAACRGGGPKSHRTGSGAPVELVTEVKPLDGGQAGTVEEVEPNDADEVATPLPVGGTLRGKIEPETDVDHVRLDLDKPGTLSVMLSGVDAQDLVLELEDAGGSVIARSDRGGARIKEGFPNVGVTAGRYTLVVREAPRPKRKPSRRRRAPEPPPPPAAVYELTAQLVTPPKGQEVEPDDDRGTANDLILGDTVTGFIGSSGDADEWKLSVEALSDKDAIDVDVTAVEGLALEIDVTDALGRPVVARKGSRGAPLSIRGLLPVVPQGGAPFYYVIVRGTPSNPETAYSLKVTAHVLGTDAEIEPDDTPDKPYAFPADRTVVHGTWTPGDVDCYALATTDQPRTTEITVDPNGEVALTVDVLIDGKPVLDDKGKPVPPAKGAKGATVKLAVPIPAGGHPVVRVRGDGATEAAYDVNVADSE